ncbi:phage holin family protein [Pseudomonas toyotomiensis]|uniref:Phage holin family protein n=1 Tax=Ectopseudomonas toyotomiensis TaxID=554344 RepID=A0AA42IQZ3_9GAMM|nr:HP1 family phage holin [Pseudomonas toyotomiensis]MDH0704333.1 phage holin family protein [Pseudomonas toyotomiensis]
MSGEKIMNGVSYAGAGVSVVSGLTLTEWGIVVGIVTALLTFAANIVYTHRKDRRDRHLLELQERLIYRDVAAPGQAREIEQ